MTLSKEEQQLKELGQEAKGFLEGHLFQGLQHHLSQQLDQEYPKPVGEEWQDKYRYAKAYEQVAADLVNYFISLKSQYISLLEKEKEKETSIDEA